MVPVLVGGDQVVQPPGSLTHEQQAAVRVVGGVDEQLLAGGLAGHEVHVVVHLADRHLADRRAVEPPDVRGASGDHVPGVGHRRHRPSGSAGRSAGQPGGQSATEPAEEGAAVTLDGCRARTDRPLVAVRGAQGEVERGVAGAQPTHLLAHEHPLHLGVDVGEAEAGQEVDVVVDQLAQPHEGDVLPLDEELPGGALQAQLGLLRAESGQLLGQGPRGALDVVDQLGGRDAPPRTRCRRRGPRGWCTWSRRCRRRPSAPGRPARRRFGPRGSARGRGSSPRTATRRGRRRGSGRCAAGPWSVRRPR